MSVVLLSLIAGFLFAAAATIQQRASRIVAGEHRSEATSHAVSVAMPILHLLRGLVKSRLWLLGWTTNLAGFVVQAAALHLGSVALVQPLLVTQLLFTLLLVSLWSRCWPRLRDWLAGGSICAGVAVFLSVRGAAPDDVGEADRLRIVLAGIAAVGLVGLLVAASAGRVPAVHSAGISVAAGLCFAMSAVLIKLTSEDLVDRGIAATATDWPGYALAASTLLGLVLEQEAFGVGPLPIAVAAMSITNPIASYALGVLAFHVPAPTGASALAAVTAAGVLLFLGVSGLSNSATVRQNSESLPVSERRVTPRMSS